METLRHDFEEMIDLRAMDNRKWKTYPDDVLPMWIAETDFRCPQPVVDAVTKKASVGIYSYYLPSDGFESAVCNWMKKRYQWDVEKNWVEFSPGVIAGITSALISCTKPGDKVVIQSPVYYSFHSLIGQCGRIKVINPLILLPDGSYEVDFEDLEKKLRDSEVTAMLVCNPHNPISMVYSEECLTRMGKMCIEYGVTMICDEAHSDIVYAGKKHIPLSSLNEDAAQISMTFVNPSKSFNMGGLKTAAAIIPNEKLRMNFQQVMTRSQLNIKNIFGQVAIETAYNECDYYVDQLVAYVSENVKYAQEYIKEYIPRVKMSPADSSYMIWLDFRDLNFSQQRLNQFLMEEAHIAMTDGIRFGQEGTGFMRMNLSCRREILSQALKQLQLSVNRL